MARSQTVKSCIGMSKVITIYIVVKRGFYRVIGTLPFDGAESISPHALEATGQNSGAPQETGEVKPRLYCFTVNNNSSK